MVLPKRARRPPKYLQDYIIGDEIRGIFKRSKTSTAVKKKKSEKKRSKKFAKRSKKPVLDKSKKKKAKKVMNDVFQEDSKKPASGFIWQYYDNGLF
jgi:hypothetical protein